MKRSKGWTNDAIYLTRVMMILVFFSNPVLADTRITATTSGRDADNELWNVDAAKADVESNPQSGFLWNKLGIVYTAHQEFQNARRAFERAFIAGYSLGLANMAMMDEHFGHGQTALAELQRYVQLSGSNDAKVQQRIISLKRNPTDVTRFSNDTPLIDTTSDASRKSNDEALRRYTQQLRSAPAVWQPGLSQPDQYQQGPSKWSNPKSDPSDEHIKSAESELKSGNTANARRELEHVLAFDGNNKTAYKKLFALLDDQSDINGAFELVNSQLSRSPNDPDYLYNLSYILARRKDTAGAEKAYQRAAALKPPDGDDPR